MSGLIPILAVVLVLGFGAVAVVLFAGKAKSGKTKNLDAVARNAAKKLAQNPRDPDALFAMGEIYFQDQKWEQAYRTYEVLAELVAVRPTLDEFLINQRCGIAAANLNMLNEAYKAFATAKAIQPDDFEVNYNLGSIEFQRKNYEKAISYFQQARLKDPEHVPMLRGLGHSLFRIKKYKEAMNFIRKAMDLAPDDKESFYTLAECYYEANQTDQALKIFARLRPDPVMGPSACLFSGTINMTQRSYEKAIEDFEIGLRHTNIKNDVLLELKYGLANACLKQQDIGKAIGLLREIQSLSPSYKDTAGLIARYQELNANKNLQVYLMSPQNDFIALCRKIVLGYFAKAKTKITNISANKNEWADLLAEVDTPKWSDVVMFRFIRSQGSVGELVVRDFHSHLKEVKAGKGICITVGGFSSEARRYTEARLIDLIDKDKLFAILNSVDTSSRQPGAAAKKGRP
ncbi:MAG: tetratricopeptide repeat protein [Treponema sp.]|jgi:tetratricopeptide (TPR) repeat protein|nr:tetratricopeptide repeat protein [Treponema sp.]